MYPVTNEFQEKIKRKFDRRVFGRVIIDYTSGEMDQSVEVSTSGNANISYPNQVTDGISSISAKFASLDGSWKLGDGYRLAPTDGKSQMGWWSDALSNSDGSISVWIAVNFQPRPIHSLKLSGDDKRGEYPVDFDIILKNEKGETLFIDTIRDNNKVHWVKPLDEVFTQVASIEYKIKCWSHPHRQAKISEIFTNIQEIYEDKDLISIDLLEEVGITGGTVYEGSISSNEIRVRLNNIDGKFHEGNKQSPLYQLFKPDRRIRAELGVQLDSGLKEFAPLGVFWSKQWKSDSKKIYAEVVGRDMLDKLMETDFKMESPLRNISLYDLALMVLKDADIPEKYYWIDNELKDYIVPYVYLEDKSHREVLRMITEACLGRTYCDRQGVIRVEGSIEASKQFEVEVSERINISKEYQIVDEIEEASGKTASLDGSWKLGEYELVGKDDDYQLGWWGNQLSNSQGLFSSPYPKATISFLPKSISQLLVAGDGKRTEYPVDYNVYIYNSDEDLIITKEIRGNDQIASQVKVLENPTDVIKVELEILKWSHPNRQAKIVEFIDMPFELDIIKADYFKKQNPSNERSFANYIEVIASPLDGNGEELDEVLVMVKDEESIKNDKQYTLAFPKNYFIQTKEAAQDIANRLLEKYNNPAVIRELKLDWRGNPALELNDIISIEEYEEINKYRVIKNDIKYTGGLKASLQGRRLT
ncbi:hypothetical protein EV204_104261 [Tissierella praeacuta]|uniref:hypothetical protein n=1 Tax=Tissierella praeacuta TaxID=43131 RepID=UPI001042D198|nr:hypothetical protein [Tissierella praeacuta]TCU74223.1 hypothetical protein EV204_104261 [Tissierella praeacuta]